MKMTIDLPLNLAAELIETAAMAYLCGREDITEDTLIEMYIRKDNNSMPAFWSFVQSDERNIRLPRLARWHQEEELAYSNRCIKYMEDLCKRMEESALPNKALKILLEGYQGVVSFYRKRISELEADSRDRAALAAETAELERASRAKAAEDRERARLAAGNRNTNMPFQALENVPEDKDFEVKDVMKSIKKETA